jgi:hypothetical protein
MKLSKLALAAWICIVVLAALLLKGEVTNAASISQCKGWSIVSSPNVNGAYNILSAATAVSASDVWAVGDSFNTSTSIQQTLIEQWNGTSWSIISSPDIGPSDSLSGVAAVSASDVWAVGSGSNSMGYPQTLIEKWNGTQWKVVNSPSLKQHDNLLDGAAVISANDIWAVGVSSTRNPSVDQTLTEHWNGTKWSIVSSPNVQGYNDYLNGVAALSAHNIWTVGSAFDPNNHMSSQTLTEFHC